MQTNDENENFCTCQACTWHTNPNIKQIIDGFFDITSAPGYENLMWEWFMAAISSDEMDNWPAADRGTLAHMYRSVIQLIKHLEEYHSGKRSFVVELLSESDED